MISKTRTERTRLKRYSRRLMQTCMNWYCVYVVYVHVKVLMLWMYERMNGTRMTVFIVYDIWTRWERHDRWGGEWTDIVALHTRQTFLKMVSLWKAWKKSPFVSRHGMFFRWNTSVVVPFLYVFLFVLFESLTFAWIALSGFQSTGSIFLFYAPNFCLDRPFGFSVHRDALYCLSRLFTT